MDWMVRPKKTGERTRYEVYKLFPETGDVVTRGGLWDTEREAQKLADNLNKMNRGRGK